MEILDGDEVRVSSKGRVAERDIVQVNGTSKLNQHLIQNESRFDFVIPTHNTHNPNQATNFSFRVVLILSK